MKRHSNSTLKSRIQRNKEGKKSQSSKKKKIVSVQCNEKRKDFAKIICCICKNRENIKKFVKDFKQDGYFGSNGYCPFSALLLKVV